MNTKQEARSKLARVIRVLEHLGEWQRAETVRVNAEINYRRELK